MSGYIKNFITIYGLGGASVLVTHMADEIKYLEIQNKYKNKKIDLMDYSSAACAGLVLGLPQAIFYPITLVAYCIVKMNNLINK